MRQEAAWSRSSLAAWCRVSPSVMPRLTSSRADWLGQSVRHNVSRTRGGGAVFRRNWRPPVSTGHVDDLDGDNRDPQGLLHNRKREHIGLSVARQPTGQFLERCHLLARPSSDAERFRPCFSIDRNGLPEWPCAVASPRIVREFECLSPAPRCAEEVAEPLGPVAVADWDRWRPRAR